MTKSLDPTETLRPQATVLIVEDYVALLEGVAELLELETEVFDIAVHKAGNGRIALDIMQTVTPDLVISDLMMPEMDGKELLTTVRQNDAWVKIPFIFLTAMGDKPAVHEGKMMGVERYVTKPFNYFDLVAMVEMLLTEKLEKDASLDKEWGEKVHKVASRSLPHEIKTPLSHVVLYMEILQSMYDPDSPDDIQLYIDGIQHGVTRLETLVTDLLVALDINTGEGHLIERLKQEAAVIDDMPALLQTIVAEQQERINNRNVNVPSLAQDTVITLNASIAEQLPTIYGSRPQLKNALARVLENAVKFTALAQGGTVDFSAVAVDNQIKITIADNGIGFPSDRSQEIFDLLYQYDRDTNEQQGAGVGLTIAKHIIKAHLGTIEATGQLKTGATLTIALPELTGSTLPQLGIANNNTVNDFTILIVEDERALREGLHDLLSYHTTNGNYNVLSAANGQEALDILEQNQPDLILSDVMMPVMDGYTFLENVKGNPIWREIPFIFLSARNQINDIQKGILSRAADYIVKPYSSNELLDIIATRLKRQQDVKSAERATFKHVFQRMLQAIKSDFLNPLKSVSDELDVLSIDTDDVGSADDVKAHLLSLNTDGIQLQHLLKNCTKTIELRANNLIHTQIEAIEHPEMIIKQSFSAAEICQPDAYPHLRESDSQIKINCEIVGDLPTGRIADIPSHTNEESALMLIIGRLVHFVLNVSSPTPIVQVDVTANVVDEQLIVSIEGKQLQILRDEKTKIVAFFADGETENIGGSDLMVAHEFAVALGGRLEFKADKPCHCFIYVSPLINS